MEDKFITEQELKTLEKKYISKQELAEMYGYTKANITHLLKKAGVDRMFVRVIGNGRACICYYNREHSFFVLDDHIKNNSNCHKNSEASRSVRTIYDKFDVSIVDIRNDLAALEYKGYIDTETKIKKELYDVLVAMYTLDGLRRNNKKKEQCDIFAEGTTKTTQKKGTK